MTKTSLLDLGVRDLAQVLGRGEASPVEVVEELAARVESIPSQINPFITVDMDLARNSAHILLESKSCAPNSLYGIPMSIKDIVQTRDLPTTWGMAALDPAPATVDGSFAAAARAAGAIIYAKSNTPPNAYADVTENLIVGATANPHDMARTAGGSSGGAGALVAAGLEALTHGTDAGGSVRMPAAHCGVVGFKPSYGLLPRAPAPDLWNARGHHGLIGRSVDDIWFGMEALVGANSSDPLSLRRQDWQDSAERPRRGRIAVARSLFGQDVDAPVAAVFDQVIATLADAGMPLEQVEICWPNPVDGATAQMAALEHNLYGDLLRTRPDRFDDGHADYIRRGAAVDMNEYFSAQRARGVLYADATSLMERFDAILTPTLPVTSWLIGEDKPTINGARVERGPGSRWPDLLLANLVGWPAISIPAGWVHGLPVGLHIQGAWRSDKACLSTAALIADILAVPLSRPQPTPMSF